MFRVFTTIIMCFTVLSGIYTNIRLFHSYSEVNVATQSVSRSDGHCSHPDPVRIQIRWSLQSPGSSPYPDQMVDQDLEMTSTALNVSGDHSRFSTIGLNGSKNGQVQFQLYFHMSLVRRGTITNRSQPGILGTVRQPC